MPCGIVDELHCDIVTLGAITVAITMSQRCLLCPRSGTDAFVRISVVARLVTFAII